MKILMKYACVLIGVLGGVALTVSIRASDTSQVLLTTEERAWFAEHPVITLAVDDAYPPLNFRDGNGELTGLTFDYLTLIANKLGIRFQFETGPWNEMLRKALKHETDGIVTAMITAERQKKLAFTQPYAHHARALFAMHNAPVIESLDEIVGHRIAAKQGIAEISLLRKQVQSVQIDLTDSDLAALKRVIESRSDYALMSLTVGMYLIREHHLTGIRPVYTVTAHEIEDARIAVRNNAPLLVSGLNKAIAAITVEERVRIQQKWQPVMSEPQTTLTRSTNSLWAMLGTTMMILVALIVITWLLMHVYGDRLPVGLQTSKNRMTGILAVSLVLTIVIVSVWYSLRTLENRIRQEAGMSLQTVARITQEALHMWVESEQAHLRRLADNPRFVELVAQQLQVPRTRTALLASDSLNGLRHYFEHTWGHSWGQEFFIIAPDLVTIATIHDAPLNERTPIADHRLALLQEAFSGESVFSPPIPLKGLRREDSKKTGSMMSTIVLAEPILADDGSVMAVMALRIDPSHDFTRLCRIGRIGRSGETYVFDQTGLLLSPSRFEGDLHQIGLLQESKGSILSLRITDPGGNLLHGYRASTPRSEQPLTRMAAEAVTGRSGIDVAGYRDYRGVRVLGAWLWDDRLHIGFATEIDENEALSVYRTNRAIIVGILVLAVLMTALLTGVVIVSGERTASILRRARDDWERIAAERTAELEQRAIDLQRSNEAEKKSKRAALSLMQDAYVQRQRAETALTELAASQQALQENEQKLTQILRTANEGFWVVDNDMITLELNPAMGRILGRPEQDAIGHSVFEFVDENSKATILRYQEQRDAAEEFAYQAEVQRPDGSKIPCLVNATPLLDRDGHRIGSFAMITDITELKEKERMAVQANQAKSEFLANMSHDLRTPLNAIMGYAQVLQEAPDISEDYKEKLITMYRSGEHLLSLINDVLDLSKIEAGRIELLDVPIALPNMLTEIIDMIRVRAQQKGIALLYNPDPALPATISADEKRLREILLNLLGNAVKFTEHGSVTFTVTNVTNGEEDEQQSSRCRLKFEIADTGIGIAPEDHETIFMPFHQTGEHRYQAQGTGLGLAISHKLVELMGGELWVRSEPGKGSVFWFEILVSIVSKSLAPSASPDMPKVTGYLGPRRRVLVIDDHPTNRAVLLSMFEPLGFDVFHGENGQHGLTQYTQYTPDVILLDLFMPDMNGFEMAKRVRELEANIKQPEERHRTVLIAISASASDDTRQQSLEAGCDEFLSKPLQFPRLLALFDRYLNLEWVYGAPHKRSSQHRNFAPDEKQVLLSIPPDDQQHILLQARRGDVRALLTLFDRLKQCQPRLLPAIAALRELVKEFQIDRIVEMFEELEGEFL